MQRAATSTQPEDIFVDLFREVFGLEKAQMLVHEFPYRDFLGNHRFVDYALKTTDSQVAFEIDGPDHYNAGLHQGLGAFLPMQQGDVLELRAHQKDAREWLDRTRAEGKSIALLQHATRTGKTFVANVTSITGSGDLPSCCSFAKTNAAMDWQLRTVFLVPLTMSVTKAVAP